MIRPAIKKTYTRRHANFAAFDILTTAANHQGNLRHHHPLGIACAAVWTTGAKRSSVWYGLRSGRGPTPRMNRSEVRRLVYYLEELVTRGYTLVTWNGTGFDWNILATESGEYAMCRQLARQHVDMMFHVVCARGHRLSLHKAVRGMGVAKQANKWDAEQLWSDGEYGKVLKRLSEDVHSTLDVAHESERRRSLDWLSGAGRKTSLSLPNGWLSVREAIHLPPPNVAGLESPASRHAAVAWMN